eukprot:185524-Rhodomonas_salina.3
MGIGYAAPSGYAAATRSPVLTSAMLLPGAQNASGTRRRRFRYALSGTGLAYGRIGHKNARYAMSRTDLAAYGTTPGGACGDPDWKARHKRGFVPGGSAPVAG